MSDMSGKVGIEETKIQWYIEWNAFITHLYYNEVSIIHFNNVTYFLAKIPSFYNTIKCNRTVNVKTAPKSRREVRCVVYFSRK